CSRHSIIDGLQDSVDFVGHLALLLFEIGFKLRQSSVLRCHEVRNQSFEIRLIVEVLRIVVEGAVQDRTVGLKPVSPILFCSDLKVCHFPPALSICEDALLRSKMSFHQALDLIFELDEATVGCTWDILRQRDCLDWLSELNTGRLIDGSSCGGIDMIIEDLDLEPKNDTMMREFLE
ncbi:hypothetical protein Tco_0075171, partial [Tanacetum coccineum]